MNKELISFKLGSVSTIFAGGDKPKSFSDLKTEEFKVPVFANGEIRDGLQGYTDKAKVFEPAVTVSARGTIGYAVLRKEPFFPIVRLLTLIPKSEVLDIFYLYYTLKLNRQFGIGSSQAQLIVPEIASRKVLLPSLPTQKKIAAALSALDTKIEINKRINVELEAMAKTLYDYWFVQFDFPNEEGKPYKSSGGKMVYNPQLKREIPEGWEVDFVDNYAEVKKGELITAKDAKIGCVKVVAAGIDYSYFHSTPNRLKNTITISGSGANAGFINFWREEIFASDCITVRGKTDVETLLLLQFLNFIQPHILSQATGSAQPHVYPNDIKGLFYLIPPKTLANNFGKIVLPLNDKIAFILQENQKLAELRDWLLPMLMNGQVTVGDTP